jgi:hypothetical protein
MFVTPPPRKTQYKIKTPKKNYTNSSVFKLTYSTPPHNCIKRLEYTNEKNIEKLS